MRLSSIKISNFRSIVDSGEIRLEPFQAFVGENNVGKSNILKAVDCFLSVSAGGVKAGDLFDETQPMKLEAEFIDLNEYEKRKLKKYLQNDRITIFKELAPIKDEKTGKQKLDVKYQGYMSEPKAWWLSEKKIKEKHGVARPNWKDIAEEKGLMDYISTNDGKVNQKSYLAGLEKYLADRPDVEYDEPQLADGKAMGIQQNLIRFFPVYHLLPAITDYSDEIDKRSSNTVFRRLMGDLFYRRIMNDPRYSEIEKSLNQLKALFDGSGEGEENVRLEALASIENAITEVMCKMMPSVSRVELRVQIEKTNELFSRGVDLKINDGVLTDVLDKGHGLQRNMVFGLLQVLMKNQRGTGKNDEGSGYKQSMLLAIEEPELYIHPHSQRKIYSVLKEFVKASYSNDTGYSDQVVYTTHSPAFVDLFQYDQVAITRKPDVAKGTKVHQTKQKIFDTQKEKKRFKFLNSFTLKHNEMFFSRKIILVEGEHDEIAIIATARKAGVIKEFPEEIGCSIVRVGGKKEMPKFQKILNAFNIPYSVWLEMDNQDEKNKDNKAILDELNENTVVRLPERLENVVGRERHFKTYDCKKFFEDEKNITEGIKVLVKQVFDMDEK